jgi:hypothetical protein
LFQNLIAALVVGDQEPFPSQQAASAQGVSGLRFAAASSASATRSLRRGVMECTGIPIAESIVSDSVIFRAWLGFFRLSCFFATVLLRKIEALLLRRDALRNLS